MNQNEAVHKVRAFTPAGDETENIDLLNRMLEQLGELQHKSYVRHELISIFERFPDAELGTPGPIVHSLEQAPIDEHVALLSASISRRATSMVIWMIKRCFNSNLTAHNRLKLLAALTQMRGQGGSEFLNQRIEQLLKNI